MTKFYVSIILWAVAVSLIGCNKSSPGGGSVNTSSLTSTLTAEFSHKSIDAAGKPVALKTPPTEILCMSTTTPTADADLKVGDNFATQVSMQFANGWNMLAQMEMNLITRQNDKLTYKSKGSILSSSFGFNGASYNYTETYSFDGKSWTTQYSDEGVPEQLASSLNSMPKGCSWTSSSSSGSVEYFEGELLLASGQKLKTYLSKSISNGKMKCSNEKVYNMSQVFETYYGPGVRYYAPASCTKIYPLAYVTRLTDTDSGQVVEFQKVEALKVAL
jgi:hypothetical protein